MADVVRTPLEPAHIYTCVSFHPSFFKMSCTFRFQISKSHGFCCSSSAEASQFHGVSVEPRGIVASAFSMLAHPTHQLYTHHGVYGGIACSAPWQIIYKLGRRRVDIHRPQRFNRFKQRVFLLCFGVRLIFRGRSVKLSGVLTNRSFTPQ